MLCAKSCFNFFVKISKRKNIAVHIRKLSKKVKQKIIEFRLCWSGKTEAERLR